MSDAESPILDFYPVTFDADLNGKKQDWEAVVKIPFIDEKRLLQAMRGEPAARLRGSGMAPYARVIRPRIPPDGRREASERVRRQLGGHLRRRSRGYIPVVPARLLPRPALLPRENGSVRSAHARWTPTGQGTLRGRPTRQGRHCRIPLASEPALHRPIGASRGQHLSERQPQRDCGPVD